MSKISVVIPAYNAAKTVERTVRSVMASTVPVEVWVVDDGSTDGTGEKLDGLVAQLRAPGLHVLHQRNAGAYMARLNALKLIDTPYFGFADADDTVESDMYEKMLTVAERENCDVVQCGADGVDEPAGGPLILPDRRAVEDGFIRPKLIRGEGSCFIWDKLYRNQYDFSQFVAYERLTNYDDLIFNFQFFAKVNRMAFVPEKLYHYADTAGSASRNYGARQFDDFVSCVRFRLTRRIPSARWLAVNAKNNLASFLKAKFAKSAAAAKNKAGESR